MLDLSTKCLDVSVYCDAMAEVRKMERNQGLKGEEEAKEGESKKQVYGGIGKRNSTLTGGNSKGCTGRVGGEITNV